MAEDYLTKREQEPDYPRTYRHVIDKEAERLTDELQKRGAQIVARDHEKRNARDWGVFYTWVGDQMPTLTSHYYATKATNAKDALSQFEKHVTPSTLYDEKADKGDVWVNVVAKLPYDPQKYDPAMITQSIADENELDWEIAFEVHMWLLKNDPDQLTPLDEIGDEGETMPVPDPDVVQEAVDEIYPLRKARVLARSKSRTGAGAGWHREPARHALAAKGVKTGRRR